MIPLIATIEGCATRPPSSAASPPSLQGEGRHRGLQGRNHDRAAPRRPHRRQNRREAEFFSFGTNDLTSTTYGISRDDINQFLPAYMKPESSSRTPFASMDQAGVGQLVKMATERGRATRADIKVGVLRRTWWRSGVHQVLPPRRAQLRLLLALPSAGCPPRGGAGGARRETGLRRIQYPITAASALTKPPLTAPWSTAASSCCKIGPQAKSNFMVRVVIFLAVSAALLGFSWRSLSSLRAHGFYRFSASSFCRPWFC